MSNASVSGILLDAGIEWSPTAFATAINHGNKETIHRLASMVGLAPPDLAQSGNLQEVLTEQQREAIILSIKHSRPKEATTRDVFLWLLRQVSLFHDGDTYTFDASDQELLDALHECISQTIAFDDVDTARLLIRNLPSSTTPDQTLPDQLGEWLLDVVHHNRSSTVRMFLEDFNMDINSVIGSRAESPLSVAARAGHAQMIKFLVSSCGANIHKATGPYANGPTPLWYAVWLQKESAARALLELGGPFDAIHAAIEAGAKRLWLAAQKESNYRSPVSLLAWMNVEWDDEGNEERFLCLEFPDGFGGEVWPRCDDEELAGGDGRPPMVSSTEQDA